MMGPLKFPMIIEKDSDGYFAFCPDIQGCYTQGDTYEEVLENIKHVIKLLLEEMNETGTKLPETQIVSFTTVEVAI
jgi:predicted RNase H-like HicB family nuclease